MKTKRFGETMPKQFEKRALTFDVMHSVTWCVKGNT